MKKDPKPRPLEFFSIEDIANELRQRFDGTDQCFALSIQRINPEHPDKLLYESFWNNTASSAIGVCEITKFEILTNELITKGFDDEEIYDDIEEYLEDDDDY
jgi:hypothetical protein